MKKKNQHIAEVIGKNIRSFRYNSNYTLKKLAEKTGLSIALLSRIENGQLSPSIKTLDKIAGQLGVELPDILQNEPLPDELKLEITTKVKRRMALFGFSVEKLSEGSGVPLSILKRFFENEIILSIQNLLRLATLLKVDLSYFFKDTHSSTYSISRKENRMIQEWMGKKGMPMYLVEVLFENSGNQLMETVLSTHVGREDTLTTASHSGEEVIYVIEGKLKFFLDEKVLILNSGDAIYFDSKLPHAAVSIGTPPAKTVHTHFAPHSRIRNSLS